MAENSPLPLHDAIALAMNGRVGQAELARRLGTAAPNVSRWVNGVYAPSIDDVRRIEEACDRPLGFIYRAAGLVECPDSASTADAIKNDVCLDDLGKRIVLATYEAARTK